MQYFDFAYYDPERDDDLNVSISKLEVIEFFEAVAIRADHISELFEELHHNILGTYTRKTLRKFIHSDYKFMRADSTHIYYEWQQPWQYGERLTADISIDYLFMNEEELRQAITEKLTRYKEKHTKDASSNSPDTE